MAIRMLLAAVVFLLVNAAAARSLLAPTHPSGKQQVSQVVPLLSAQGQQMLMSAEPATLSHSYFPLAQHSESQVHTSYCGVASSVMVLNALSTPRPPQDPAGEFVSPWEDYYTQANVFGPKTQCIVTPDTVKKQGMTIDQLAGFLDAQDGVTAFFARADASSPATSLPDVDRFRQALVKGLPMPRVLVVANFDHGVVVGQGGGHHSPVAAFHVESDSVLVLDVSRYLHTAYWVPIPLLWEGCSRGVDSESQQPRGITFAWAEEAYDGALTLPFHL